MTYLQQFESGNVVIPAALLFNFKNIFASTEDFLVWQFFFYQNTSHCADLAPSTISEATGLTVAEVNRSIASLQSVGVLEFKTVEMADGIELIFNALPALDKLDRLLATDSQTDDESLENISNPTKTLVTDFERELGRFLSPFEIEELQKSLEEEASPDLIRAALKQAVLNGKPHWRYIQTILKNWRREGITTLAQVEVKNAEFDAQKHPKAQSLKDYQGAMNLWKD